MGVYWSSPSSQRRRLTPRRAMVTRNRRRVASHRDAWTYAGSVPVVFSEWRGVLEALRTLPPIAVEGCCSSSVGLPAPSAALTSEGRGSSPDIAAQPRPSEPSTKGGQ